MVAKVKDDDGPMTMDLGEATRSLSVRLTDAELLTKADRLAQIEADVTQEKLRQVDMKEQMKARIASLESERGAVASSLRSKCEFRDIKVRIEADFNTGRANEYRQDTGALTIWRPLTDEEKQRKLFTDGKSGGDAPDDAAPAGNGVLDALSRVAEPVAKGRLDSISITANGKTATIDKAAAHKIQRAAAASKGRRKAGAR